MRTSQKSDARARSLSHFHSSCAPHTNKETIEEIVHLSTCVRALIRSVRWKSHSDRHRQRNAAIVESFCFSQRGAVLMDSSPALLLLLFTIMG